MSRRRIGNHEQSDNGDSDADDTIYPVDDVHVVIVAHLVNQPSQQVPPQECAYDDEEVTDALGNDVVHDDEGEHRESRHKQEYDKRIGKRDCKPSEEVLQQSPLLTPHLLDILHRL